MVNNFSDRKEITWRRNNFWSTDIYPNPIDTDEPPNYKNCNTLQWDTGTIKGNEVSDEIDYHRIGKDKKNNYKNIVLEGRGKYKSDGYSDINFIQKIIRRILTQYKTIR